MKAIEQAQRIYEKCVAVVGEGKTITYRNVLDALGYDERVGGRVIRYGLELVWIACLYHDLPCLAAMIVNQSSGAPSDGYAVQDWQQDVQAVFAVHEWPAVEKIDWEFIWTNRHELSDRYETRGYWTKRTSPPHKEKTAGLCTPQPVVASWVKPLPSPAFSSLMVAGIDVGDKRKGFHAVSLCGGVFHSRLHSSDVAEITHWCRNVVNAQVIAVDAPCRWRPESGNRPAERQLLREGIMCFSSPTRQQAVEHPSNYYGWMLNGEALFEELEKTHTLCGGLPLTLERPLCFLITIELQPASAGAGGAAEFAVPHKPAGPPWYRVETGD